MLAAAACDLSWRTFDDLKYSIAWFNRDIEDYWAFRGVRLGGSDHPGEPYDLLDESGKGDLIGSADGLLKVGECTAEAVGGGVWHTQRIGPFRSMGGYDWWNVYHRDFRTVQHEMDRLISGRKLGITAHVTGPVTMRGDLIPLPPIHNHHVHILETGHETHLTSSGLIDCFLRGERCFDESIVIQHHGDYQCTVGDGGTECFGRKYGSHIKLVDESLGLMAQLNDVRPVSPLEPLEWWYQVVLRTEVVGPNSEKQPLSTHSFMQPHSVMNPPHNFDTIDVPSDADSLVYYTGRMPFGGSMAGGDWHSHALKFQSSLLAAAAPHDLGLSVPALLPEHTYDPIITAHAGFADNIALREHMLSELALAAQTVAAVHCREK